MSYTKPAIKRDEYEIARQIAALVKDLNNVLKEAAHERMNVKLAIEDRPTQSERESIAPIVLVMSCTKSFL